jgi:hypothetical protein
MAELQSKEEGKGMDIARGIIGKFGVGFYSVFMIADKVEVRSRPASGGYRLLGFSGARLTFVFLFRSFITRLARKLFV